VRLIDAIRQAFSRSEPKSSQQRDERQDILARVRRQEEALRVLDATVDGTRLRRRRERL
jgi:hypothetical protein